MKSADRKLAYSGIIVLCVIAAEIAWFLFVGPTDGRPNYTATCEKDCGQPWWESIGVWTMLFTGVLTGSTILLWLETRRLARGADDQADKMERSVTESARAATAMEGVSVSIATNVITTTTMAADQKKFWQRQMRAYVSVVVGGATYQERSKKLKFAGLPRIINDGMTPAHDVKNVIKAAIVDLPIDPAFNFDLPGATSQSAPAIGPRQFRDIRGIVADYVPDEEIAGIKDLSANRGLLVWGRVDYNDAFGDPHHANFAQILFWHADNSVHGAYMDRHNDSD